LRGIEKKWVLNVFLCLILFATIHYFTAMLSSNHYYKTKSPISTKNICKHGLQVFAGLLVCNNQMSLKQFGIFRYKNLTNLKGPFCQFPRINFVFKDWFSPLLWICTDRQTIIKYDGICASTCLFIHLSFYIILNESNFDWLGSRYFCYLEAYAQFQNTRPTPSGRKWQC
jgi:hypothetical protein